MGPWIADTAALYLRVFRRGGELALRNWTVGLALLVYAALLGVTTMLVAPLGLVGGLLLGLVGAACASSWLALTAQIIRSGRADLRDLPGGFFTYVSELLSVWFFLWLLRMVDELTLAPFPFVRIVLRLAIVVFFNVVPELIYLGRHQSAELLVASYRFISENWIEWFPATLLLTACVIGVATLPPTGPYGIVTSVLVGVVLAYTMIVRGLLFIELTTSSRRAREFRRRAER